MAEKPLKPDAKRFDVFISYCSEDNQLARRLRNGLVHRGLACWLDTEQLKPGEDWTRALRQAIDESRLCILVLGRHAEDKPWVSKEWALVQASAWDRSDLAVVPVLLDDVDAPAFLRKWQSLRCDRRPADVERVCSQIAKTIERPEANRDATEVGTQDERATTQRFRDILDALRVAQVVLDKQGGDKQGGGSDE